MVDRRACWGGGSPAQPSPPPATSCPALGVKRPPPPPLPWPPVRSSALGWPIDTPSARHGAGSARPARRRACARPAEGVAARGFGCRRVGGVHGPCAGPRHPTATWAGRSSRRGHTPRSAVRGGQLRGQSARMGGGGPVTRCERAVAVVNGRSVVTSALTLGSERNQGWRAARRGHADDAAAWFVPFGRVWRARGAGACGRARGSEPPCSLLPKMAASRGEGVLNKSGVMAP